MANLQTGDPAVVLAALGVSKHFGALQVLHGVDLQVRQGEALGIVGPNGAGKTTLFGVLAGTLPASHGQVLFDGCDISAWDTARRCRAGIGRTHQVPRPFLSMSVADNVRVAAQHGAGLRGMAEVAAVQQALARTGLDTLATRPADTLGLLDRKRLELARALATQPKVLLLDEIGGGLTEAELLQLVALVGSLHAQGLTLVWIEHVLHALLKVVGRLVCMDAGAVLAEGEPAAVMAHPRVVQAYLGGAAA
ncbi:MAG: ATP-binding cassette domain-containing protein [Rubrivivax sp.]|nr:ATP-binding cassette domain-containing protein [Rubrivivax sp.]